ncbi:protein of unknown function [Microbulbifer donghaiensis]|uniref:DUF4345 domain-containing protein n=1 Tax=Microbulbifer donghaiensis TaxID=494016 RepID=A0A1M5CXN8_9GAMM|nr:DUF4345 family protein [Microbulbifer donghaiensis]SHF59510.1 protein of unknown function [Microbulbifer donghaiensis]
MKYFGKTYLVVNLLIYAAIGVAAFVRPEQLAAGIDLGFLAPTAVPEFLATFGGFMLAIAAALAIALSIRQHRRVAYASLVLAYLGFACGRLYGMLMISGVDWRNSVFLALELLLLVWGIFCYRETRWLPLEYGH